MKKLLILLLLATICQAQDQKQPVKVVANVQSQIGEIAILQTSNPSVSYLTKAGDLELEKQYVFWLRITGCFDCRTRRLK